MTFDTFMRWIVLPLGFIIIFILANWAGNRAQKKQEEEAIAEGNLRIISHAEYNRLFGIENKLTVVENKETK